jgi:PilZ domain
LRFQPRQFPRVPIALTVRVYFGSDTLVTKSLEIGAGGMALDYAGCLSVAQPVKVSFALHPDQELTLDAVVWWKRDQRVGIRFDLCDRNRCVIQDWVEKQIKLGEVLPLGK